LGIFSLIKETAPPLRRPIVSSLMGFPRSEQDECQRLKHCLSLGKIREFLVFLNNKKELKRREIGHDFQDLVDIAK
jgi:hypothetical protein